MKRLIYCLILALFLNFVLLVDVLNLNTALGILSFLILAVFFIRFNVRPSSGGLSERRLKILSGGYELMFAVFICSTLEILLYVYICFFAEAEAGLHILIINAAVSVVLLLVLLLNGIIRIFVSSKQLGLLPRIYLLFLWWVPIVNILLFRRFFRTAGAEYVYTSDKYRLNIDRKHEEVCKTKYPILMVHGIFFRDWENFNYWGRIPEELIKNGAVIYYGSHQSTAAVPQSADEVKQCILEIIEETNCEKVNIIAHSKGGLDSRYAVSCLGMGKYVASLTTINTPHRGCNYVKKLLDIIPHNAVASVGKKYESIYSKLGDESPDFFNGLIGLTDKECARLNGIMKDDENVLYQSVGSKMRTHKSAAFPLNIGYLITKCFEGENDGLVSTKSMLWGDFLGVITPKGRQGISHGDMIDLTRKNIEGFDVCEFYVDLVNKLKLKGL